MVTELHEELLKKQLEQRVTLIQQRFNEIYNTPFKTDKIVTLALIDILQDEVRSMILTDDTSKEFYEDTRTSFGVMVVSVKKQ